jgi:hypothetical protein
MQNLTDEDRRRIFEEEKAKLAAQRTLTGRSWVKFAVLLLLIALVIYGAWRLVTIRKEVTQTDERINQQSAETAKILNNVARNSSQPPFALDLEGQINRVKSEGSDSELLKRNIQQANSKITYELLKKNADKYAGEPWFFTGRILEIFEQGGHTESRISLDSWGSKPIWIAGDFTTDFVEKNQVFVVGYLAGNYSYTSQAGWKITIPALAARAILKPGEAAKLRGK